MSERDVSDHTDEDPLRTTEDKTAGRHPDFNEFGGNNSEVTRLPTTAEGDPVGYLVANGRLRITQEGDDHLCAAIGQEARDLMVGEYVQLPLPAPDTDRVGDASHVEVLLQVDALEYESEVEMSGLDEVLAETPPADEANERRHRCLATLDPISVVEFERDGDSDLTAVDRRSIGRVPKPYTAVYRPTRTVLQTGLGIPESGTAIGHMVSRGSRIPHEDPVVYRLPNPGSDEEGQAAIWRHLSIVGKTGKGKSHTTKNLLRQYLDGTKYAVPNTEETTPREPCIVVIDPKGEYLQLGEEPTKTPNGDPYRDLDELAANGVETGAVDHLTHFRHPDLSPADFSTRP